MSGYSARCPSCGAPVVFQLGASLLRVCDQCGAAVARKGADLASYGKVAELIPTPSVLALGARGGYAGAPSFELIGRLQLDYGAGTWDEWLMVVRRRTVGLAGRGAGPLLLHGASGAAAGAGVPATCAWGRRSTSDRRGRSWWPRSAAPAS